MAEQTFIDPKGLARITRLELVARQAVEGFLAGRHPSPYHGSSVEYADHRPYSMGDELRSLDWKLLAKTDKYYVKLFEDQTNLRCTLLVDCSRSMAFASDGRMTKLRYASHLAAALGYLMLRQNDAVGLAMFDNRLRHYLPARSTASHFRLMVDLLDAAQGRSESRMAPVMHELASRLKRRGLIIIVSDLLDDPAGLFDALGHFRYRKHEIIVFHVMDPNELTFPYERLTRFKDMEGTSMIVANPGTVRRRYMERLEAFMNTIKGGCLERDVTYELATTDTPWDKMLGAYLDRRSRLS
ncbi:MAG: DUF58 domain-containing protein [Actinobacteria bacterium]|nr:DUF58 domain-containing protein [Actinomycetota bacterium]